MLDSRDDVVAQLVRSDGRIYPPVPVSPAVDSCVDLVEVTFVVDVYMDWIDSHYGAFREPSDIESIRKKVYAERESPYRIVHAVL